VQRVRAFVVLGSSVLIALGGLLACADFGSTPEAVQPSAEASPSEAAANDAPAPDAPDDAPAPVDDSAALDASTLCGDAAHWICDDFDHDGSLGPPTWTNQDVTAGATLTVDPLAGAPSMPNVLTSRIAGGTGTGVSARLDQTRSGSATALRCDFDLSVPAVGDAETVLFEVALRATAGSYTMELRGKGGMSGWYILQGTPGDGGVQLEGQDVTLTPGKFSHVSIRIAMMAGAHPSAKIDGVERLGATAVTLDGVPPSTTQQAFFGAASVSLSSSPWAARFDNIVCDVDP
jgi:hypothetical protein